MVLHPHGRLNSGLMVRAWNDTRGQTALEYGIKLTKVDPPANCFCDDVHTDAYIYFNEGEYYDAATRTPIKDMGENEKNPNNYVSNPNTLYGDSATESYDYSPNHSPLSECVPNSPTMSHNPLNSQVVGLGDGHNGGPEDRDMDVAVDPIGGASPYNGSKSLVTGKRGFSPFFKSKAVTELLTHCTH